MALFLAVALQTHLEDDQFQDWRQIAIAVLFCTLWPILPALVALMKWDIRRMQRKRDYHS